MSITCKACGKVHKVNSKIEESIQKLAPGQKIRLKCNQCEEQIVVGAEILSATPRVASVRPPEPPDTTWLADGDFEEEAVVSDIPQALVLINDEPIADLVTNALTSLGYRAELVEGVLGERRDPRDPLGEEEARPQVVGRDVVPVQGRFLVEDVVDPCGELDAVAEGV